MILIIDDQPALAKHLADAISAAGSIADRAADGEEAPRFGLTINQDAVVLDLGSPKLSGPEVLRRWRKDRRMMPGVIPSARGTCCERVAFSRIGADDYMAKPFHAAEVVARLRALMRRSSGSPGSLLQRGRVTINRLANIQGYDQSDAAPWAGGLAG